MKALHALLEGLIDYAGLFPPASIDMQAAVGNYSAYRGSDESWMLGRFVVPAQRLTEFSAAFAEACCGEQTSPWLLSVLSTADAEEDFRLIESFSEGAAFLEAIEFKAADVPQVEKHVNEMPSGMVAYVEFPPPRSREFLPILKKLGARAKIRTGGVTEDVLPSAQEIAHFLTACAEVKIPFKATAGLHHPLRSMQKLTYEENSASAVMHGFINVFVAAAVAYQGAPEEEVVAVLNEESPAAFQWEESRLTSGQRTIAAEQLKEVRENFATGFGSCSFAEPIRDLKALGWL
jgi:hypothetical protein